MKFFLGLLLSSFVFTQVSSASSYREENCRLKTSKKEFNFYSDGAIAPFVVQSIDEDLNLDAAYLGKKGVRAEGTPADLELKIVRDKNPTNQKFDDGCYVGRKGYFIREVSVVRLSENAREILKIKQDAKLNLDCSWTEIAPKDSCLESGRGMGQNTR